MLHFSQWTSQFVQNISMTIRHPLSLDPLSLDPPSLDPLSLDPPSLDPLSLDPHIVQGNTSRETPQFKGEHGRKLRESNRGGIPLPGRTDVQ